MYCLKHNFFFRGLQDAYYLIIITGLHFVLNNCLKHVLNKQFETLKPVFLKHLIQLEKTNNWFVQTSQLAESQYTEPKLLDCIT